MSDGTFWLLLWLIVAGCNVSKVAIDAHQKIREKEIYVEQLQLLKDEQLQQLQLLKDARVDNNKCTEGL